jgi:hypothetical protein
VKRLPFLLVLLPLAMIAGRADGAPNERRPYIGYLSPAGGRQGMTVTMTAGGQNLRGVNRAFVSGQGLTLKVVKYHGNTQRLRPEVMREIAKELRKVSAAKVRAATTGKKPGKKGGRKRNSGKTRKKKDGATAKKGAKKDAGKDPSKPAQPPAEMPDHPLLRDLEKMSLRELKKVQEFFFDPTRRTQESPQIAETVTVEVTIADDAAPGIREIRLGTPNGLTNPMVFHVGGLPEFREQEPNDFASSRQEVLTLPIVVNGQVSVRDVDRFRFRAKKGQRLVIEAHARRLVPYLADAVPGWFQATLALFDSEGNEVSFGDDYRHCPDPVIFYRVPKNGEYEVVIRDSIDRGREDFVYRITIGERPFIRTVFPLGGRMETATVASVSGWNLPFEEVALDTGTDGGALRHGTWRGRDCLTNTVPFAVDDLPECVEAEPNGNARDAHVIDLPIIANGRIETPGDADLYRFEGRAGDVVVAEVYGRRLDSPIDSRLELIGPDGRVLVMNDDTRDDAAGLCTHHADSYIREKLPASGPYRIRVTDAQHHGGPDYAYRLRIGPPRPDFTVLVTPSAINVPGGGTVPITVHAVRKDGFDGAIELLLPGAPKGMTLSGGRIPAGKDRIRATLTVVGRPSGRPHRLKMAARARIGERTVRHRVVPVEDQMQAFGLRHLVPVRELLVDLRRTRVRRAPIRVAATGPVQIPKGGSAFVRIRAAGIGTLNGLHLELGEPPAGVALEDVRLDRGDVVLLLSADSGKAVVGDEDNLVVEIYRDIPPKKNQKGRKGPTRRWYSGVLPAIPVVVTE